MFANTDFKDAIHDGVLSVFPFDEELLQPASLDLRLSDQFITFRKPKPNELGKDFAHIDPAKQFFGYDHFIPNGPFFMEPGEFMLASTVETVGLSEQVAARVEGKSSLGRLGLLVHATAGFVDPGFHGQLTLELKNLTSYHLKLHPGQLIAQLTVEWMDSTPEGVYGDQTFSNRYQGQTGPVASRIHEGFKIYEPKS